jgi:hypothetical protein
MKTIDKGQFLLLEKELQPYRNVMTRAVDAILDKEVSDYPILVVHQQTIELGVTIVDRKNTGGTWSIHASSLEEFAMKQLIETGKIEDFQSIYKDPKEHLCLFVISELGAQFIFLPREQSKKQA